MNRLPQQIASFCVWACLSVVAFGASAKYDTLIAWNNLNQSIRFNRSGDYEKAYQHAIQAVGQYKDAEFSRGQGVAHFQAGLAREFLNDYSLAYKHYNTALHILRPIMPEREVFLSGLYTHLGAVCNNLDYLLEGRQYLDKAMTLGTQYSDEHNPIMADVYFQLGSSGARLGEGELAIPYIMKAMPVYLQKFGEHSVKMAQIYNVLGVLYTQHGDLGRSIEYYNKAIAIYTSRFGRTYWELAKPYNNLANMEADNDKALEYLTKATRICKANPDKTESVYKSVLLNFSNVYLRKGESDKSLAYANEVVELANKRQPANKKWLASAYSSLGQISMARNNPSEALSKYRDATRIIQAEYGASSGQLATYQLIEGLALSEAGHTETALKRLHEGLRSCTSEIDGKSIVLHKKIYVYLLYTIGKLLYLRSKDSVDIVGRLTTSLGHFVKVDSVIHDLRRSYSSDFSKFWLQGSVREMYAMGIDLCYRLYEITRETRYIEQAFLFSESNKATILSEAIHSRHLVSIRGIPDAILLSEQEAERNIRLLELQLAASEERNTLADSMLEKLSLELFRANVTRDSLNNVIRIHYPDYHQLKYSANSVTAVQLQNALQDNHMVLSFFQGANAWYVIGLSRARLSFMKVLQEVVPDKLVLQYHRNLVNPLSPSDSLNIVSFLIYRSLVAPSIEAHKSVNRVIVVPDGLLSHIPFETFIMHEPGSSVRPRYLVEDFTLSYEPSVTLMIRNKNSGFQAQSRYVGFAPTYESRGNPADEQDQVLREGLNDLGGATAEIDFGRKLFSGTVFIGPEATEHNFKTRLIPFTIIHLAMHAEIDEVDPMNSRLYFAAGDTEEDGLLKAGEIYNLNIQSELTILSACNTGAGQLKQGEGIINLARAFMFAGSQTLVMSLWPSRDQPTRVITSSFLENLKSGQHKDEALRNAKLSYLQSADPIQGHPAYWAPLVLMGSPEPLSFARSRTEIWLLVAAGLAAFSLLTIFLVSKIRGRGIAPSLKL